jgi:hypothetical protein
MVVSASLWVHLSASWTPRRRVGPYVRRLPIASFRKSTCSIRTLVAFAVVTPRLYSHCSFAWLKMPSNNAENQQLPKFGPNNLRLTFYFAAT